MNELSPNVFNVVKLLAPKLEKGPPLDSSTPVGQELVDMQMRAAVEEKADAAEVDALDAALNSKPLNAEGKPLIGATAKTLAQEIRKGNKTAAETLATAYEQKNWDLLADFVNGWEALAIDEETVSSDEAAYAALQLLNQQRNAGESADRDPADGADYNALSTPGFELQMANIALNQVEGMIEDHFVDESGAAVKQKKRGNPVAFVLPDDPKLIDITRDPKNPDQLISKETMPRLWKQIKAWQHLVDTLTRTGVYQRFAQTVAQTLPNKGLDTPDYSNKLLGALSQVIRFGHTIRTSSEKDSGEIWRNSPEPEAVTTLDLMMQRPIIWTAEREFFVHPDGTKSSISVDADGKKFVDVVRGGRLSAVNVESLTETDGKLERVKKQFQTQYSVVRCRDVATAFNVSPEKQNSEQLFINPEIMNGDPFTISTLIAGESEDTANLLIYNTLGHPKTGLVFSADKDPDFGRTMNIEQYATMSSMRRTLNGKELFYDDLYEDIAAKLEVEGYEIADIVEFHHNDGEDRPLNMTNGKLHDVYSQVFHITGNETKAQEAVVKYMIGELVYVRYGLFSTLAVDSCEVLQLTPQWDPKQIMDHLAETWIKAFGQQQYEEKYAKEPAGLRGAITAMLRPLLPWKMKDVDYAIMAMESKAGQLWFRNPISADHTRPLEPIKLNNGVFNQELVANQRKLMEVEAKKLAEHNDSHKPTAVTDEKVFTELAKQRKELIEGVLYAKTEFRMVANLFPSYVNAIREAVSSGKDQSYIDKLVVEARKVYLDRNLDGKGAPQQWPRNTMDAMAIAQGMSVEERKLLEGIDFRPFLESMGYQNMNSHQLEYEGWAGLTKLIENRSTGHFVLGHLEEKLFKYMSKYPGMSAQAYGGIVKLCTEINQGMDPWIYKYFGGKPEKMGNFTPDQVFEGLLEGALDLTLFYNKRTPKEAMQYFEGIWKVLAEEVIPALGYMDQGKWRESALDLVEWIVARTRDNDELAKYTYKNDSKDHPTKAGVHGDQRQEAEIPMDLKDDQTLEDWADKTIRAVKAYRRMGARVVFPDLADQDFHQWLANNPRFKDVAKEFEPNESVDLFAKPKNESLKHRVMRMGTIRQIARKLGYTNLRNPYVVWGNQPVYEFGVDIEPKDDKGKKTSDVSQAATLNPVPKTTKAGTLHSAYGHRGGEALMLMLLTTQLMDKGVITKADAHHMRNQFKAKYQKEGWFTKTFGELYKESEVEAEKKINSFGNSFGVKVEGAVKAIGDFFEKLGGGSS